MSKKIGMTEKEAIEELKYDCNELGKAIPCDTSWGVAIESAYDMAIKALEEIQQYRAIGTIKECQAAIERKRIQKPKLYGDYEDGKLLCPNCENDLMDLVECGFNCCPYCGQAIDWGGFEDL